MCAGHGGVIPGTTKVQQLEENLGAVTIGLMPDGFRDIEDAAAMSEVHRGRYSEAA